MILHVDIAPRNKTQWNVLRRVSRPTETLTLTNPHYIPHTKFVFLDDSSQVLTTSARGHDRSYHIARVE